VPVSRPAVTETTALGAAYLAGLATGVWSGTDDLASHWRLDRCFEPSAPADAVARRRERWREAVERAKGWSRRP
jgi:glycerol kinase